MATQQVETATVVGTVTGSGNATVTVTAFGMANSPKAISVAVSNLDTASIVGGLVRTALAFDTDVAAMFLVSGSSANVVLTKHVAAANDTTLNIAIANGTCTGLTAAPTSTNTTAGDGLENAYCTLAQLKSPAVLNITASTYDTIMELAINSASRLFDEQYRRFYSVSESRYYTPKNGYCLEVDDIATDSGVTVEIDYDGDGTYEVEFAATDYTLGGYNSNLKGWPFSEIEISRQSNYTFPLARKSVKVTAPFGWSAVPKSVNMACLFQANREWARLKTPLGQAGTSAIGQITLDIPMIDPDAERLMSIFKRIT